MSATGNDERRRNAVIKITFDLSQLDQKSWFHVVNRALLEAEEVGRIDTRAELAALRAIIKEQEQDIANITAREAEIKHNYETAALNQAARMTALEASVEQARELLTTLDWNDWDDRVDAWLAAHPAPQAEQEKVK